MKKFLFVPLSVLIWSAAQAAGLPKPLFFLGYPLEANIAKGNLSQVISFPGTCLHFSTEACGISPIVAIQPMGQEPHTGTPSFDSECKANVSATASKRFMCYNLGVSNMSADEFAPNWEVNGSYWQWGSSNAAASGPGGPDAAKSNAGIISKWSTKYSPNGAWSDKEKTKNDPCPKGYRIPTKMEWEGVISNNTITYVGTWSDAAVSYNSGVKVGDRLFLPASGARNGENGALFARNSNGYYWSSTEDGNFSNWSLEFTNGSVLVNSNVRIYGFSVRCIEE